jgi:hypothetical protein
VASTVLRIQFGLELRHHSADIRHRNREAYLAESAHRTAGATAWILGQTRAWSENAPPRFAELPHGEAEVIVIHAPQ